MRKLLYIILILVGITMSKNTKAEVDFFLPIIIEQHLLENGLRVILSPDHSFPTVSVAIYYDVGSRNEEQGKSGFAHLFEHLMFQGSKNVGKFEHITLINDNGGSCNGTTSEDRTNYFESLPSNKLELALWLEADRMQYLNVTQENFENQRQVVIEEKKLSIDSQPYGPSFILINKLAYGSWWPYSHPVIGYEEDLLNATLEDAQNFYKTYYVPNNAVIAIVGDFEPEEALKLVKKYFGNIARGEALEFTPPPFTPPNTEIKEKIEDPLANLPAFHLAYHIPPLREKDHYPLEVLAVILGDGRSSRLVKKLVQDNPYCQEIYVSTDNRRGPDLFSIFAILNQGIEGEKVREIIYKELKDIEENGLKEGELERAKNRLKSQYLTSLQTNLDLAQRLAMFTLYWGDPTLLRTELNNYLKVTEDDIKKVIGKYLTKGNRIILDVLPSKKEGDSPK